MKKTKTKQTNLGRRLERAEIGNTQSICYFISIFTIYWMWFKPSCDLQSLPKPALVKTVLKTQIKPHYPHWVIHSIKYLCLRGNVHLRFQLLSWICPLWLWFPCWNHGIAGWKWCNVTFTRGICAINCFLWLWEGDGVCVLRVQPATDLSCTKKTWIAGFIHLLSVIHLITWQTEVWSAGQSHDFQHHWLNTGQSFRFGCLEFEMCR